MEDVNLSLSIKCIPCNVCKILTDIDIQRTSFWIMMLGFPTLAIGCWGQSYNDPLSLDMERWRYVTSYVIVHRQHCHLWKYEIEKVRNTTNYQRQHQLFNDSLLTWEPRKSWSYSRHLWKYGVCLSLDFGDPPQIRQNFPGPNK